MAEDDSAAVRGIEMDESEVDAFLTEQGHGTLALASDGAAYAVPISFGYDGDHLYLHLIRFGEDSEKLDFVAETTEACLMTYEADTRFDWRCAIARGPMREVPAEEEDAMDDVIEDNAWIPSLFPPTSPMTAVESYALDIEEATGRKGEAYQ